VHPPSPPPGGPRPVPAAAAYWPGWPEIGADLRSSVALVLALALTGLPAGLLWWLLAPRADFRITADGPVAIGNPSGELLVADDAVFTLLLAGIGLIAGAAAWWFRRRRGVATVIALAVGSLVTGLVAWRLGELLGAGPTEAQVADVGARVTTALQLGGLSALAVAPFTAVLAYLVPVVSTRGDDLGRVQGSGAPEGGALPEAPPDPFTTGPERDLVEAPPPGRPSV
jgi:LPXTG-motif cell wall-anchored protein